MLFLSLEKMLHKKADYCPPAADVAALFQINNYLIEITTYSLHYYIYSIQMQNVFYYLIIASYMKLISQLLDVIIETKNYLPKRDIIL